MPPSFGPMDLTEREGGAASVEHVGLVALIALMVLTVLAAVVAGGRDRGGAWSREKPRQEDRLCAAASRWLPSPPAGSGLRVAAGTFGAGAGAPAGGQARTVGPSSRTGGLPPLSPGELRGPKARPRRGSPHHRRQADDGLYPSRRPAALSRLGRRHLLALPAVPGLGTHIASGQSNRGRSRRWGSGPAQGRSCPGSARDAARTRPLRVPRR